MYSMSKRSTPFQKKHQLEYALKIATRNINTADVESVECKFCLYFGRESYPDDNRKRRRTEAVAQFSNPFRPELYRKHHESSHPGVWSEYKAANNDDKKSFFDGSKKKTLHSFFESSSESLQMTISAPIVDELIGKLFYHPEDDSEDGDPEPITKANAMKLFKLNEDGLTYSVLIKNPLRFQLAIEHTSVGLSFRQTAAVIKQHRDLTKNTKLTGLNDHMVGQFVRIIVAVDLQILSSLLSKKTTWAFSLAGDGSTHLGVSFFDIRVRICVNGVLYNLHLVAVPFFDRHTAVNIFNLIVKILNVLCAEWRDRLLSVSSDGENTMTGRHGGVVTLLEREATHPVLRIWCVPHQMDLIVKSATNDVDNGKFYKTTHAFSVHLRAQQKLITAMNNVKCPKDTTRWVQFGSILKFMVQHRRVLLTHVEEKQPASAPSVDWWIIVASLSPIYAAVNTTFAVLQSKDLVLSQQRVEVQNLAGHLASGIGLNIGTDLSYQGLEESEYFISEDSRWWLRLSDVRDHIEDQGSWVRDQMSLLSDQVQKEVLLSVTKFVISLVDGFSEVQAERDSSNNAAISEEPPVMPQQLVPLRTGRFISLVLDPHRPQLAKASWSEEEIESIEEDHRSLIKAIASEPSLKASIDAHTHQTMFNDAWDAVDGRFASLRSFVGGLATAFANTTSVESDFSILKWEKDSNRTSLTNLSLEGIFQTKQHALLSSI